MVCYEGILVYLIEVCKSVYRSSVGENVGPRSVWLVIRFVWYLIVICCKDGD